MPLFWRIFLLNALVLITATALLLGPVTVSTPVLLTEAAVLTVGLAAMLVANALLLRVGLAPLQRLTRAMTTTDLLRPGRRPAVGGQAEVAELITTFNTMLDRLEDERATSSARVLSAQEAERRRIARELHDEVGQTLTAVLLELKRVAGQAPPDLLEELRQVQETTRAGLDEIRRIAHAAAPRCAGRTRSGECAEVPRHRLRRALSVRTAPSGRGSAAAGPGGRARPLPGRAGGAHQCRPARAGAARRARPAADRHGCAAVRP